MFKKLLLLITCLFATAPLKSESVYMPETLAIIAGGTILSHGALKLLNHMCKKNNLISQKTYTKINTYTNVRSALTLAAGTLIACHTYDISNPNTCVSLSLATWGLTLLGADGSAALLAYLKLSTLQK